MSWDRFSASSSVEGIAGMSPVHSVADCTSGIS